MSKAILNALLAGNATHIDALAPDAFEGLRTEQRPAAVSMCCADSRVSQEGMWAVDAPGWLFTPSTIGNQVWDVVDGERVIDGSVQYPLAITETTVAIVVGHTGCGAITAALERHRGADPITDPGIAKWVSLLEPVIEDGLADGRTDTERKAPLVDQLVEYNVDRQVAFLLERGAIPDGGAVYGFVYDFQGTYGDTPGRAYLVNFDGETDPEVIRSRVPNGRQDAVARLH